jgi:hypothetical protein
VVLTECPSPGTLVKGKIEQDNLFVLDVFPLQRRVHPSLGCLIEGLHLNPGGD